MGCSQSQNKPNHQTDATNQKACLELPRHYNVDDYIKCLKQATDEGDAACLLRALLNCSKDQRQELMMSYSDVHGQSLQEHIKASSSNHTWPPWVLFTTDLLLLPKHKSSVNYLMRLLSQEPINEITFTQVLCSHGDDDIQTMLQTYREMSGKPLTDMIKEKFPAESAEALCSFLSKKEDVEVNMSDYVSNLIQAAKDNKLFTEDCLFFNYLRTVPSDKLRDIFETFLRQCQRDLTVEIEKHYSAGRVQDTLKTIVNVIRNAPLQRVNRIHELLSCAEDKQCAEELCFLILSPALGHLPEMKQVYKTTHFEMLAKDIQDQVSDNVLKRVLLHAIK